MVVFCLREIAGTVAESSEAWDKRGYWKKAADFQLQWEWTERLGTRMEALVRSNNWDLLPQLMTQLYPHFSGMSINKLTRPPSTWSGSLTRLLQT